MNQGLFISSKNISFISFWPICLFTLRFKVYFFMDSIYHIYWFYIIYSPAVIYSVLGPNIIFSWSHTYPFRAIYQYLPCEPKVVCLVGKHFIIFILVPSNIVVPCLIPSTYWFMPVYSLIQSSFTFMDSHATIVFWYKLLFSSLPMKYLSFFLPC